MAINKIDLTQVNETLSAVFNSRGFQLSSIAIDTSMIIEGGGVEEIGNYLYRSVGTTTPTDATGADGDRYLYISDDGTGVGTAEILTTVPEYSKERGGFYYKQKKCIYYTYKSSGNYTKKTRYGYTFGDRTLNDFIVGGDLKTDDIVEKTSGEGVTINNNAYIYTATAPPITAPALAALLSGDNFVSDVWYPATGIITDTTDRWGVASIKHVSGSSIYINSYNYSLGAIYTNQLITGTIYFTLSIQKAPVA